MELTIAGLRDKLFDADEDQLRELICQLYKCSKTSQQVIESRFLGEGYCMSLAESVKQKIDRAFFPLGKVDRSLISAKKLLREFRKSCQNQAALIDVELYFVECGLDFMEIFGDLDQAFKDLLVTIYASAIVRILEDHSQNYFHTYYSRCNQLNERAKEFTTVFSQEMLTIYSQLVNE